MPSVPKTPGTPTKTDTPELTSSSSQDKEDEKDEFEYREKGKTDIEVIKELRAQLKYDLFSSCISLSFKELMINT